MAPVLQLTHLLLVVIALAATGGRGHAQDEPVARILELTGAVAIVNDEGSRPAGPGSALSPDDTVVTERGARARIAFGDGSSVTLGESTALAVARFAAPPGSGSGGTVLDLVTGIVRVIAGEGLGSFDIRSRAAVASVRGTRWIVEAGNDTDAVFAIAGRVAVSAIGAGGEVILTAGEGVDVTRGESPPPPVEWGEGRVREVMARTAPP